MLHVYLLFKGAIKVSCFDIKLTELIVIECCDGQESADRVPVGDGCKCVCEVLTGDLGESLCKTNCHVQGLFMFDNVPSHLKWAPDALSARKMVKSA